MMMKQRAIGPKMRYVLQHFAFAAELKRDLQRIIQDPGLTAQQRTAERRRWLERVQRVDFAALDSLVREGYDPNRVSDPLYVWTPSTRTYDSLTVERYEQIRAGRSGY